MNFTIPEHMKEYCKDSLETLEAHAGMPWDQLVFSMPGVEVIYEIIQSGILPVADTHTNEIEILENYVRQASVVLYPPINGKFLISTNGHVANGETLIEAIDELR